MSEQNMPMPQMRSLKEADVIQQIREKVEGPGDDGFIPLVMAQYIDWRVQKQLEWYTGRIEKDYSTMRNNRVTALAVAGIGSVLAGIGGGLEGLVGVTTALGVALTTLSDVRMYGRTYRIYYESAFELKSLLSQWQVLTEDQRQERRAEFLQNFERVFDHERKRWREDTIRTLISSEQAIYSQVQQVAGSQAQDTLVSAQYIPTDVRARPTTFNEVPNKLETPLPVTGSYARPPETPPEPNTPAAATAPLAEAVKEAQSASASSSSEA